MDLLNKFVIDVLRFANCIVNIVFMQILSGSCLNFIRYMRGKGIYLTQSFGKSPDTNGKLKKKAKRLY